MTVTAVSHQAPMERLSSGMALVGLYGFCLSMGPSVAGVNVFSVLILLATALAAPAFWRDVRSLPVFWLMAGFLAYIVVQSLVFTHYFPALDESSNPHWTHVARTAGLISLPMGWWMARNFRHVPWLLGVAGISLAAGILTAIDIPGLMEHGLAARQYWGRIQGEISYLSAMGLLGCWLLAIRLFLRKPVGSLHVRLTAPLLAVAGAAFLLALYGSQTRSTWGATAVTLGLYVALELIRCFKRREALLRAGAVILVMVLAVTAVVSLDDGKAFDQRLGGESRTLDAVMDLDPERIIEANESLGIRVFLWIKGVEAFADRPVVGWGIGSLRRLDEDLRDRLGKRAHFHNAYLELLVGVGIVGVLMLAAMLVLLLRQALKVSRMAPARDQFHIELACAALLLSSLTLFFEIRVGHTAGRAVMIFLLALLAVNLWYPWQRGRPGASSRSSGADHVGQCRKPGGTGG